MRRTRRARLVFWLCCSIVVKSVRRTNTCSFGVRYSPLPPRKAASTCWESSIRFQFPQNSNSQNASVDGRSAAAATGSECRLGTGSSMGSGSSTSGSSSTPCPCLTLPPPSGSGSGSGARGSGTRDSGPGSIGLCSICSPAPGPSRVTALGSVCRREIPNFHFGISLAPLPPSGRGCRRVPQHG